MMGMLRGTRALAVLLFAYLACVSSAVTFDEKKAYVYDNSPKIRIWGTGIDTLDASKLELSFAPKLKKDKDYKLEIQSATNNEGEYQTYIALSLQSKKWIQIAAGAQPQALYLSSVKTDGKNILDDSVQIATIVPAPTVTSSDKIILMRTTPKLAINGTNFNTKNTELYFDPPLEEGVDIRKEVLSSTTISLTKIYNDDNPRTWKDEPGPLKVKAINTGAGKMMLNPSEGGIVVAEVQADGEKHDVNVQSHEDINIYQSTKTLQISGTGFLPDMKVRFGNALRGSGTNYTMVVEPEVLTLTLAEGSVWRRNPDNLPGALVLLAAELGGGWVPLGPVSTKSGRKVATVFADPSIDSNEASIYRTHTHELMLTGTGFTSKSRPVFSFDPPIDSSRVFQEVVNRTTVRLTLSGETSEWTSPDNLGPLTIKAVNTGAGEVPFDPPITVATVVADTDVHESGVQVIPSYSQPKYQSSDELYISGTGFKGEPVLNFDPPIWAPNNYTLEVKSETELKLMLVQGSKWRKMAGSLVVKGINVGDGDVELAGGDGVKVATIFEDPVVYEANLQVYASHTKRFPVRGSGFYSAEDNSRAPTILLDGIPSSNYRVEVSVSKTVFYISLLASQWADVREGETKPIRLSSINTGAGQVDYPGGVVIAEVRPDSTTALCEDSCAYANDGRCDEPDGSQPMMSGMSYSNYFSRMSPKPYYGWGYDDDANSFMATNDYSGMYRYAGYMTTYRYYGLTDDGFYNGLPACEIGTDCSDCGVKVTPEGTCENTCQHARDGVCDDPRFQGVCAPGTDCQDCGAWGEMYTNFTMASFYMSGSWYADDDDWAYAVDDMITYGQENNAQGMYKRNFEDHTVIHKEDPGAGEIFVNVLWAMVVLVGCSVSIGGCMVAFRHFKAGGGGAPMYLPVQPAEEVELSRRGASAGVETTPDVVRIG